MGYFLRNLSKITVTERRETKLSVEASVAVKCRAKHLSICWKRASEIYGVEGFEILPEEI